MKQLIVFSILLLSVATAYAAQDVASAVEGTVKSIDRAGKVVVVDTADGAKHTFYYSEDLVVHAGDGVDDGAKDTFHGVAKGSKVAVHYTVSAGKETALEIDSVGRHGLKAVTGTLTHVDHASREISVKTADGTVDILKLTGHAADESTRDIAKDTEKSAKVSAYYTEDAGEKTVHFIGKAF